MVDSAPPVDHIELFIEWILRHGRDFEHFRYIYRRNVETYVNAGRSLVLKTLSACPNETSLDKKVGELSQFFEQNFKPVVDKAGGLFELDAKTQAYVVQLQTQIMVLNYVLKYKYNSRSVQALEMGVGPLENIYSI